MSDEQRTTRFLFPSQPQQAVHAVFESTKHQQGAPGFKEKMRQASLPPLKSGARGGLVAPGSKPSSLACYKHYDVQLDWSETDVDTSVWAGDVQAYTRMFYARYGAGPPGATPWRLGRGLQPQKKLQAQLDGKDTDTFITRAHIEIQEKLQHTSLDLWQQFSSSPIESVDLDIIKMWAEAMRPRSIHDLKPMLMLCQSLLRDLASVHKEQLVHVREEMQQTLDHQLLQAKTEQQARENALQRRVDSLNALVTAPFEPREDSKGTAQVAELKREQENMLATLIAQLEEKEADLIAVAQDLIARGGVPKGAGGVALPINASAAVAPSPQHSFPSRHGLVTPVSSATATSSTAVEAESLSRDANRTPTTPNTIGALFAGSQPCGLTADGKQIVQYNGTRAVITGHNVDGSPIYADADDPSRVIVGVDASGHIIYGNAPNCGTATCPHPTPAVHAEPTGQHNAAGQEVLVLADGTQVVVVGRTASGDAIYALADDPLQILAGTNSDGSHIFSKQSSSAKHSPRRELSVGMSLASAMLQGNSSLRQELSDYANQSQPGVPCTPGSCTAVLEPGAVPPPQVVVSEDGTKRYVFATAPGTEPLEVGHQAVIATRDDGTPIFAAGTVLGVTADGAAIVADGRGGTFEDYVLAQTRVDSAAVREVLKEREERIRDARLAGALPQAGLFMASTGADTVEKAGEYLAAAVLQQATPSETAEAAATSVITAVESGAAAPEVFTVGDLALNCDGEVVGRLAKNGLMVEDFDGVTICAVEKVKHADGQVLTQSGVPVQEEFVRKAAESIVTAAVVRSFLADDAVVGYASSSHKRVVDDSGSVVGCFDGKHIVYSSEIKTLAAQPEQESAQVCLPPDFAYAIGPSGNVLGQMLADGQVMDATGTCTAMMQPDGVVKTAEGLLVGAAARGMPVMGQDGKLVAVLNEQGFVKNVQGIPFDGGIDMDYTGVFTTTDGDVVGMTVGAAPRANAAIRNNEGELVGFEDARGVVCSTEGIPVARCFGGEIVGLPGMVPEASHGHKVDLNTTVVLDAQKQVIGSTKSTFTGGMLRVGTGSSENVAIFSEGHHQSNGLLYSSDGSVVGSCVPVVVAGLAVVSTSGAIIGDVSAEGVVTSSTGADLGTVDKQNVLWSPSGSVMGAVSSLQCVRGCTSSIFGAVSAKGQVLDNSLAPVPTAACCGKEVWSDEAGLVGIIQGLPPPLLLLIDISRTTNEGPGGESGTQDAAEVNDKADDLDSRWRCLSVAWNDLRVTRWDGESVGWWCSRRCCIVDAAGEEVMEHEVKQENEGPSDSLPQALDQDGNFLGYVLPTKAVVDAECHQVGVVMPDGAVFDSSLTPIGAYNLAGIKPRRNVIGANGTPLGFLQLDGRVISPQNGANTGFLTPSGAILSEAGQFVGFVRMPSMDGLTKDADGIVRDADGNAVGHISSDGTLVMGDPFTIHKPPEMVNEAVQVALVGMTLAQLLAGESEKPATPPPIPTGPSSEASSSSSMRLKKLRAATKLIGLTNVSKRNFIKEQLERLAELRAQILEKMQSRQVKDSLLELRKYRRPPRAAAQVITALMVICNEPLCVEWRHQALQGLQFPDHPNHVAQIWVALTPLLQPNLSEQLAGVNGTELSQDMQDRLKAAQQIMQGMTEKEAKRASYVVRLLHEFIDLLQESNLKAHEFSQLDD